MCKTDSENYDLFLDLTNNRHHKKDLQEIMTYKMFSNPYTEDFTAS